MRGWLAASLLAGLVLAAPAYAQRNRDAHESRDMEKSIIGDLRFQAENEFRDHNNAEARDTCRELLGYIDNVRWIEPGSFERDRDWAAKCADGSYAPYSPPPKLDRTDVSTGAAQILFRDKLAEAYAALLALDKLTPYDPAHDRVGVFRQLEDVARNCEQLKTGYAVKAGPGAVGLAIFCIGIANRLQAKTVKPEKRVYFCGPMREAQAEFARIDVEASMWTANIRDAQHGIELALARPECQAKK